MKIAVFYNLGFSGAKRTVFEHVKGLKALGHTIDVYTLDTNTDIFHPGTIADAQKVYSYIQKTVPLPFGQKISKDLSDFHLLKNIHKEIAHDIDQGHYDIALVHTDKLTQAPFLLRFLKTKHVYFCLEPLKIGYEYGLRVPNPFSSPKKLYEQYNRYIRKQIDRDNARAADFTMAISLFGRELMIQSFDLYPKVSYLGVAETIFKKKNVKKKNQILFVGQKLDINGYHYALSAMKLIPEKIRPELKVLSIGDPKNRISDEEMAVLYNESLLTFSLSNFDTFGLVPLESLACETPVIAFNVAGYRETMKNNETGYLVDFDAKEIAEKSILLLVNKKLSEEMGKKGRAWIEKEWTWKKQIAALNSQLTSWSI